MAVLRASVGFVVFFAAFSLKSHVAVLGIVGAASMAGNFLGVVSAPVLRKSQHEEVILRVGPRRARSVRAARRVVGGGFGFVLVGSRSPSARARDDSASTRCCSATVLMRGAGGAFAKFETRFQIVWVVGAMFGIIPFAVQMGLFLLAGVLAFAAVSYVAALRDGPRCREMRTQLLPGAVDRELRRHRRQAMSKVKGRFAKPKSAGSADSAEERPEQTRPEHDARRPPPVDPEAPTAP